MGTTTVLDCSSPQVVDIYKKFQKENKLKARLLLSFSMSLGLEKINELKESLSGLDNRYLKLGVIREVLDGDLLDGKAALLSSYADEPENKGRLRLGLKELKKKIKEFHDAGFHLSFKASGDRAVTVALKGIEAVLLAKGESRAGFWIEKVQFISSEDWEKFAKLKVRVVGCPAEMLRVKDRAEEKLGLRRVRWMFPWKSLLDKKAYLAFSSYWPQEPLNPLWNIYVAITRQTLDGKPPGGWLPWEKLDLDQALSSYTQNAARCLDEEKIKGTLEKNKLADIIVLSRNIYEIPASEIPRVDVGMTFLGGKLVYFKPGFEIEIFNPDVLRILNIILFSMNLGKIPV